MKYPQVNNFKHISVIAILAVVIGIIFLAKYSDIYLNRGIALCQKNDNYKQTCYKSILDGTLEKKGLARAFDALALIYSKDPKFASDCHGYTHDLGKAGYKLFHAGKEVELTPKASYCGFGFYHGFMEELFYEGGTMAEARAFCSYAGEVLFSESKAEGACYHGIGHGATDGADPRVWGSVEKIIAPALALCERVGDNDAHKNRCASGVFNSLAVMYGDSKYRLEVNVNDPYRICEKQRPDYFKRPCYEQMNTLAFSLAGFDLAKSVSYILKINEETYAESAVDSLASYAPAKRKREAREAEAEYLKAITACRLLSGNILTACIRGYGAGLVEFGAPGREYEESLNFCQNGVLSDEEKKSCLHRVLFYLAVIYPKEKVSAICERYVASTHQELCKPFG